jgi:hypothetical protein
MKRGIAASALLCALLASRAAASPARAPSPAAAKKAFGRLLHQLYGPGRGYWTCPAPAVEGRSDCFGEVHSGHQWHQVSASARRSYGTISMDGVFAQTWIRHWWPYARHWIAGGPPGVASVNSSAYGWGFLASGAAELKDGRQAKILGYDGDSAGLRRFYLFRCSRKGGLITCRNALGDAMRYRPEG